MATARHHLWFSEPPPDDLYDQTASLVQKAFLSHRYQVIDLANRNRNSEHPTVYIDERVPYRLPDSGILPDQVLPWHVLAERILMDLNWPSHKAHHYVIDHIDKRRVEELRPGAWPDYFREMSELAKANNSRGYLNQPVDQDRRVFAEPSLVVDHGPLPKIDDQAIRHIDPTRTKTLRRGFRASAQLNLNKLRATLCKAIIDFDMLGLSGGSSTLMSPADRLRQFSAWFETAAFAQLDARWWVAPWIDKGIKSGLIRAHKELGLKEPIQLYQDSFAALHQLVKQELDGIIAAMIQKVTRIAHSSVARRNSAPAAMRRMAKPIDDDIKYRLRTFANAMTNKAHNVAKIETYRQNEIPHVGIIPERKVRRLTQDAVGIATAEDDLVCQECEDLADGSPYSLDEAEDLLPVHGNCRCSVIPWEDDDSFSDAFDPNQEREPAGGPGGGQFAPSGGINEHEHIGPVWEYSQQDDTFSIKNHRSIGLIVGARKAGGGDEKLASENLKIMNQAIDADHFGYARGLKAVEFQTGGAPLGTANYIGSDKPKRGFLDDYLWISGGTEFTSKNDVEKIHTILHELGHRGQIKIDPKLFRLFAARGLGKYFPAVTNPKYVKNYKSDRWAGETFAESYSRYMLKIPQPKALDLFWKTASDDNSVSDADWDESQHPREAAGGPGGGEFSSGGSSESRSGGSAAPSNVTIDDLDKWTPDWSKIPDKKIRKQLQQAMWEWTSGDYEGLNKTLRQGKPLDWAYGGYQTTIRRITRIFNHAGHSLDRDIIMYRGLGHDHPEMKAGQVIEDRGFASFAHNTGWAKAFAGDHGVILHVVIPKGTRVLSPDAPALTKEDEGMGAAAEPELMIKRGSKFRIERRDRNNIYARIVHSTMDADIQWPAIGR